MNKRLLLKRLLTINICLVTSQLAFALSTKAAKTTGKQAYTNPIHSGDDVSSRANYGILNHISGLINDRGELTIIDPINENIFRNEDKQHWKINFITTDSGGFFVKSTDLEKPTGVSVNTTAVCTGSSVSLSATCAAGTVTWYNQAIGGSPIGTGTGLSQSPTVNTIYYASCKIDDLESSRESTAEVVVTNQPINPSIVSVDKTAICSGTSVSLSATCSAGTITWYNQASGGSAIGTGTSFSQSPTVTTTYYASCKNGICESGREATNEVVVTTKPINPTNVAVDKTSVCPGFSVLLTANCSIGTVTWYNQSVGGQAIGTGTSLSLIPTSNTSYYASCKNSNCESNRLATNSVSIGRKGPNPSNVSVSNTSICAGSSISLSATCSAGTINWYTQLAGGSAIGTGTAFIQSPTTTTTYYASCKSPCEGSRVAASQVVVTTQPTNPSVDKTAICSGTSVTLTATCATGTVTWYNQASGGTAIGTGTALSQSPTITTTYYASCVTDNCETSRINTSEVVVTTVQPTIPTGAEVDKTAICSGTAVSLSATCSIGTIIWYAQASGGSAIGTGTAFSQSPTVTTTYYASCKNGDCESSREVTSQVVVTVQPTIPSSVEVDKTAICSGTAVSLTATCSIGTIIWYTQASGGSAIGTGTAFSHSPAVTTTYYASCKNWDCESSREATSQVVVTVQPTIPTGLEADKTAICSGTAVSLSATCSIGTIIWYNQASGGSAIGTGTSLSQSPSETITYYASCKNGDCESGREPTSQVVVTAQPTIPKGAEVDKTAICSGTSISLTATCSIGTINWYTQASGGTAIGTGTDFSQSPAVTTTYYASCKNGDCESSREPTSQVVVTAQPTIPSSVEVDKTTICSGTSISLTATCSIGTIIWYTQASGGSAIGTGTSLSQSPSETITYYASCKNGDCESSREPTSQVVVTAQPTIPTGAEVDKTAICSGTAVSLTATCSIGTINWYTQASGGTTIGTGTAFSQSPTVNTTYYASCKNGDCESAREPTSQVVVTVQPTIPTGAEVDKTAICSGTAVSLTATCSIGTINWYTQASGGSAIGTGTAFRQSATVNTTYYASCKNGDCESAREPTSQVVVTVQPTIPSGAEVDKTAICSGTAVSLTATCSIGTIIWYTQASEGSAIGTGTAFSQSPTVNTTYYASCKNGDCESSREPTSQVVVTAQPTIPTGAEVDKTAICSGTAVSLTATCSIGTIIWYNQASDGSAIGTGTSLSQSPSETITYYVSCKNGDCESGRESTDEVVVTAQPTIPTGLEVDKTAICSGTSISLSATCSIGTIIWYNQASGGSVIGTGTSLSQSPSETITYYASCKNGNCESSREPTSQVVVTVQPTIPTGAEVDKTAICSGTSISLTATCSIGTIIWYNQASGGSAIGTGEDFSQSPTVTTTYYASCKNGDCESGREPTSQVVVTVQPTIPTSVEVDKTAICSGTAVSLSATCSIGTIIWYAQASGGSAIGMGTTFSQSPSETITYYASCKNGDCESSREPTSQVVVTAQPTIPTGAEVDKTAICSGTAVSLTATCSIGTINWYTQASGGSAIGTGTSLSQSPSETITYYASCKNGDCESSREPTSQVVVTAQPTIPSSVEVDKTAICSGTAVSLTATCSIGTIIWYNQVSGGTAIGTGTDFSQSPTVTTTYYASCKNGDCESSREPTSQVVVTEQPTIPTGAEVDKTAICSGTSISLTATCSIGTIIWYNQSSGGSAIGTGTSLSQSPSETITYYASCKNGDCESSREATSQVVVTAQPTIPTGAEVDKTAICSGTAVSLTATCSIGTIIWYNQASGGSAIGTGTAFSQSPSVNTTYYASCKNGDCESGRESTVEVVVTVQPTIPTGAEVDKTAICSGTAVSLTATCSIGTINWYNQDSDGSAIGTGTSLSQSPSETITYYASCKNGDCESSREATSQVVVTVQPTIPSGVEVDKTAICSGTAVSLTATCSIGTIIWYNQASEGSAIGTGTDFSQSPSETITYYASCKNGDCESGREPTSQVVVTAQPTIPSSVEVDKTAICSGTSITLSATCSIGTIIWYNQASEGSAIGTGTAFSQSPSETITYYASCKNGDCESSRELTVEVVVTAQPTIPTGLEVDKTAICSGNSISLTATCSTGTIIWYTQASGGSAIGTGEDFSQSPTVTTTYYASCKNGDCESSREPTSQVVVTVEPTIPTGTEVDKTAICSGTSISLTATCSIGTIIWYTQASGGSAIGTGTDFSQSPSVNTTYYASCKNGDCESSREPTSQVVVTAQPTIPTDPEVDKTAICSGTAVSLTATCSIGTIIWYNQASEGSAIGTGTSLSQSPSETITYYASCKNGDCESGREPTSQVVVTAQPTIPTGTEVDKTAICSGTSISLTATCSSGTINWYNQASGGSSIGTGTAFSQSPSVNTTYYASCKNGDCESDREATSQVVVTAQPTIPTGAEVDKTAICSGTSVSLTATCSIGTINWYTQASGGTVIGTGTAFSQSPTVTTTYYASCKDGDCESGRIATSQVTVTAQTVEPTNVSVNNVAICSGTAVSLSATCSTGILKWYTSLTGGTAIGTGTDFGQSPTITTKYYAACENGICISTRSATLELTVTQTPASPSAVTVSNNNLCSGASVSLSANCTTGTVNWYKQLTGGTSVGTGSPLSQVLSATASFYAACENGLCTSNRVATSQVVVTTTPASPTLTANKLAICQGDSTTLTGQCSSITDVFRWSSSQIRANALTGLSYNGTRNVKTPGTYKAICEAANGCISEEKSIIITQGLDCSTKIFITITPDKPLICPGTSITLSASGCTGLITWLGGTSTKTGTAATFNPIINTTYTAQCSTGGMSTIEVKIAGATLLVSSDTPTGTNPVKATRSIESSKKIGNADISPGATVTFEAGSSIILQPGFVVEKGSVFKAEIKGCN